jgi:ubiquinone/menaquinone biosynthesis C-methylase UbiE
MPLPPPSAHPGGMAKETFQITAEAAELYESVFVPSLFAEWAPLTVGIAQAVPGSAVLDVACGTGVVARAAAEAVAPGGRVVGLDLNPNMLAVARRVRPDLDWRQGDVADLPFPDGAFDVVTCQMALMFFPDREAAVREMARVTAPGGSVALCVPAGLGDQPAYGRFVDVAARHAGPEAMSLLGTYWSCGDLAELTALAASTGLTVTATRTHSGTARFPSSDALVATEVESTPLVERISPIVYEAIRDDARAALAEFTTPEGRLDAPLVGHLLAATPAAR